jgi:drug/metabolite transporter (DMT)-like permease
VARQRLLRLANHVRAQHRHLAAHFTHLRFEPVPPRVQITRSALTPSTHDWVILLSLSVAGATSQLLLFEALRHASASTIAPLEFTSLAWAFVLGHVAWGDIPDIFVLSGAMLIGVSGFIIVLTQWRETRLKKADARP